MARTTRSDSQPECLGSVTSDIVALDGKALHMVHIGGTVAADGLGRLNPALGQQLSDSSLFNNLLY